jgi:cold shock CspA family protein
MRIEGTLAKWNDDRGFGFIAPTQGGPEVFVHISAFQRGGQRPQLGERLSFEIEITKDGKKRAKNILCPGRSVVSPARQREPGRRQKQGLFGRVVPLILVAALGVYGYSEYFRRVGPQAAIAAQPSSQYFRRATPQTPIAAQPSDQDASAPFHCDGRTHCSQMTSCAEATFFLNNCPNVRMDGNHNGVPCEEQWCTSVAK